MLDDEGIERLNVGIQGEILLFVWNWVDQSWTGLLAAVVVVMPPDQPLARSLWRDRSARVLLCLVKLFSSREHFSEWILTDNWLSVDTVQHCR